MIIISNWAKLLATAALSGLVVNQNPLKSSQNVLSPQAEMFLGSGESRGLIIYHFLDLQESNMCVPFPIKENRNE